MDNGIAQKIIANPDDYSIDTLTNGVQNGTVPAYIGVPLIQEKMLAQKKQAALMGGAQQANEPPIAQQILGEAAHKVVNPYLFRVDEVLEIYKRIQSPTLVVEASDDSLTQWWKGKFTLEEFHERLKSVTDLKIATLEDAGHMLHHDQAEALAQLLEDFLA